MLNQFKENILPRLKHLTNSRFDYNVADKLNIANTQFSSNIKKDNIPYKEITEYALEHNLSLDEIFGNKIV